VAVAVVTSTFIAAVFLMLAKSISSSFDQNSISADFSWINPLLAGILLLLMLMWGLRSFESLQFVITISVIYFAFRVIPPYVNGIAVALCWIFSCLALWFDVKILALYSANFFFAFLFVGYVLLFYDKIPAARKVIRSR